MRIGYDAKRAFLNERGLGNYSRNVINMMAKSFPENEYMLFTPKYNEKHHDLLMDNTKAIMPHGIYKIMPSVWRTRGMVSDIEKQKVDVYHGLSHEIPYGIEKTKARTVVTMHDVMFLQFPELYNYWDRKLYKKKYLHSCDIADKVIAISEQTKKNLLMYAGVEENKIEVVTQACNPIYTRKCDEEEKRKVRERYKLPSQFILTVSAVEKRKNQKKIVEAMAEGKIDIQYVIVGRDSSYSDEIRQYAEEKGITDKVMFLSGVPDDDMPAIYQMAMAFVFPSLYEGFGAPLVEAMTSEIPMLCSRGECFTETVGDTALMADSQNTEEWIYNIDKILNSSELRRDLVTKANEFRKRYSEEYIAERTMNIYKSIM